MAQRGFSMLRPVRVLVNIRKPITSFRQIQVLPKFRVCKSNISLINIFPVKSIKYYKNSENESSKKQLLLKMNFKSEAHAEPFYDLPMKTLLHIYKVTENDKSNGYCDNRLYYLSTELKCSPSLLSKYIPRRIFIYTLSFHWLQQSLTVLLDFGVPNDRIIRDLWVLKYKANTIKERLENVKELGVENLYPWMVRCSTDILNRYVKLSQDTKNILRDTESNSTRQYLANRLNLSNEDLETLCLKAPTLRTIRATKVKTFLDFLISEGFTAEDIARKPRILAASQTTVKHRIEVLRKLGLKNINLNILCRSRNNFKKYCESYETSTNQS